MTALAEASRFAPVLCEQPLVQEAPVAVVCNGATVGVMMASPRDLEDFALGFAVTEGLVRDPAEILECEVVRHPQGYEARLWLTKEAASRAMHRQRALIGPVGCGLCGIDSLAKVARPLRRLPEGKINLTLSEVSAGPDMLRAHQPEHDRTRACHAAGFLLPGRGILLAREDVGRHNALDKLAGALAKAGVSPSTGAVILTSRVSTEIMQKTIASGARILVAASRATDYAAQIAMECNLTLVTTARGGSCEMVLAPGRLSSRRPFPRSPYGRSPEDGPALI